jgi:hypothetical protein
VAATGGQVDRSAGCPPRPQYRHLPVLSPIDGDIGSRRLPARRIQKGTTAVGAYDDETRRVVALVGDGNDRL